MNLKQINDFRVSHGLAPIVVDTEKKRAEKIQRAKNHASRAAANRELRNSRSSKVKGK
jgi:hypothetical protein